MGDRHDDYEPIIAPRRSRQPRREEAPLWRTILGVVAVFAVVILLAWWWSHRPPDTERAVSPTPAGREALPETHVEQEIVPPARDPGAPVETPERSAPQTVPEPENAASEPPAASDTVSESEDVPEVEPESVLGAAIESPSESEPVPQAPAHVSVRFTSPDSQVRFEIRRPEESAPFMTTTAGATLEIPPGRYRVTAAAPQLDRFEQDVTFGGAEPLEYVVELCTQPKYERGSLAGRLVESRECGSAAECETLFAILGEYADDLVRQRDFRAEQCAKWRAGSAPGGNWTLNIRCDGAMPATTCRVEIGEGECMYALPPRSARGAACPKAELR